MIKKYEWSAVQIGYIFCVVVVDNEKRFAGM